MTPDAREITAAIASSSGDAAACAAAFGTLYDWKFGFVFGVLRARTGADEATCLDLVQETMLRVIKYIKTLPDEAALDAWLARVAVTTAYDHYRRDRRRRGREIEASQRCADEPTPGDDRVAVLRAAMAELEPGVFELLALRFGAGMTLELIGRRFGVGPGAADGRLRRALRGLRERVEEKTDAQD